MLYEVIIRYDVEQTVKVLVEVDQENDDPERDAEASAMSALEPGPLPRNVSIPELPYDLEVGDMTVIETRLRYL